MSVPKEPPGPLCASQLIDRTFTSITSLCLPPQPAQNSPSVSSQHALISSNSVTLPSEEAGTGFKQDKTRKTRCDREEGFTKDRKHRDMLKDQKRVMEGGGGEFKRDVNKTKRGGRRMER